MSLHTFKSIKDRREFLESETKTSLSEIGKGEGIAEFALGRNIENPIGTTQIPVGVAGPLKIKNYELKIKNYYIPLSTTEGALVASVNRGCKAIALSGGVIVSVENVGVTRGSVFKRSGNWEIGKLGNWITKHIFKLQKEVQNTSSHIKLLRFETSSVGKYVFVRWYFDTADAMGLNMVTIASQKLAEIITSETGHECISLAGNFDVDKKPSWLNFINGRGKRVSAEIIIPENIVKTILKTTPEKIAEVVMAKDYLGSIMSGSMGYNGHFANIIAALFIATGQDPAHVVEGSLGVTTASVEDDGSLYFSVYLPDLMVGTVGGGTHLPTQREALELLSVYGGDEGKNATKFAHIVGAAVLAGEVSLTASLAEGSLARAHEKLGRGKIK